MVKLWIIPIIFNMCRPQGRRYFHYRRTNATMVHNPWVIRQYNIVTEPTLDTCVCLRLSQNRI